MGTNKEMLCASNLCFSYKKTQALRGVSFSVEQGTIHGFVGPNGAGKTTALKIFATLLKPGSGSVRIDGFDVVREYKRVRRMIGFMPDHLSLYRQMTVYEYLDFFGAAYGLAPVKRKKTVNDIITLTDLGEKQDEFIRSLSRGQQQRVLLARVLVHDPALLLLDEPASGLDPRARIELMEILRELKRIGKTVFISSHILSELGEICDSVTILHQGEVRFSGKMKDLQEYRGNIQRNILLLGSPHPDTAGALRALEGMNAVELDESGEKIIVEFNSSELHSNDVLKTAIESGAEVASYREDVEHLNQAFMKLTETGASQ